LNSRGLNSQLEIANFYKQLQTEEVIFAYKGAITGDLFDSILTLAEEKLSVVEPQVKLRRKINVITVEILQNIFHHFDILEKEKKERHPLLNTIVFLLGKSGENYFIVAGNFVPSSDIQNLRSRIDSVNALSPNELKLKYREVLNNGEFSPKGGAGLGIIDIARKSGQRLEYDFTIKEHDHTFFVLKVFVPAE
jgi:hypothetical protein